MASYYKGYCNGYWDTQIVGIFVAMHSCFVSEAKLAPKEFHFPKDFLPSGVSRISFWGMLHFEGFEGYGGPPPENFKN